MIEDDTWYKCTICGREGRVGRCCGDETRIPLNKLAIEEQSRRSGGTCPETAIAEQSPETVVFNPLHIYCMQDYT